MIILPYKYGEPNLKSWENNANMFYLILNFTWNFHAANLYSECLNCATDKTHHIVTASSLYLPSILSYFLRQASFYLVNFKAQNGTQSNNPL